MCSFYSSNSWSNEVSWKSLELFSPNPVHGKNWQKQTDRRTLAKHCLCNYHATNNTHSRATILYYTLGWSSSRPSVGLTWVTSHSTHYSTFWTSLTSTVIDSNLSHCAVLYKRTRAVDGAVLNLYFALTYIAAWDAFTQHSVEIGVRAAISVAFLQRSQPQSVFTGFSSSSVSKHSSMTFIFKMFTCLPTTADWEAAEDSSLKYHLRPVMSNVSGPWNFVKVLC